MNALGEEASSDAELVRTITALCGAGNIHAEGVKRAEAELCRRFAPRIRLYGLRHLRSEDRARDLVQTVLLAVLVAARAGRVEDAERFDRFVLGTCRHASLRMRDVAARAMLMGDEELDVTPFLPETEFIDTGKLMGCIAALDVRGRVVVTMSFLEERSADEIAKALETTAGNVRVVRHRAIGALRHCLDGATATNVDAVTASRETS